MPSLGTVLAVFYLRFYPPRLNGAHRVLFNIPKETKCVRETLMIRGKRVGTRLPTPPTPYGITILVRAADSLNDDERHSTKLH